MADSPFKTFVYFYRYEGSQWEFLIKARDRTEADERIACLALYAQFQGELGGEGMVFHKRWTWLVLLVTWIRDWLERRKEARKK
jgi:hypothetical protein